MRRVAALLLLLAGCSSSGSDADRDHDTYARQNPVGRFQMVPVQRNGVGVVGIMELDTREGTVRYCQPKEPDAGGVILQPDCSGDSDGMNAGL